MDEQAVRDVLLVRALEDGAAGGAPLPDAERQHAARTAAELARWEATRRGGEPDPAVFVASRARLLRERLATTQPAIARAARALAWRPALAATLPVLAGVAGVLLEQVADRGHVNVLAFPLLAIVAWNLGVYLLLALAALRSLGARAAGPAAAPATAGSTPRPGALRALLLRTLSVAAAVPRGPLALALGDYFAAAGRALAPLAAARAARVLHLCAAAFAAGAVAGLYLRGLVFDYRVGWESTFLDAGAVHALLATVLAPAAAVLGRPVPDAAALAAIRFPASAGGAEAALWIHLHALTVVLAVLLPRLALATLARWRESQLARDVPLALDGPYFRRLLGGFGRGGSRLRVVPYSHTVDEPATAVLRALAQRLFGDDATLALAPTVPYGDEARAAAGLVPGDAGVPLSLALFSLAATPEVENHGAFLDALRAGAAPGAFAVLLDSGGLQRRFGAQAPARIAERLASWRALAAARGLVVAAADLGAPADDLPKLAALEGELEPALAATGRAP